MTLKINKEETKASSFNIFKQKGKKLKKNVMPKNMLPFLIKL